MTNVFPTVSQNKVVMLVMISTACADAAPGRHETRHVAHAHVARDRSNVPRRDFPLGNSHGPWEKPWKIWEKMEEIMGKPWKKTGVTEHHFTSNGEWGSVKMVKILRRFARLRRQELPTLAGDQSGLEGEKCPTESTEKTCRNHDHHGCYMASCCIFLNMWGWFQWSISFTKPSFEVLSLTFHGIMTIHQET
jgi:hypothetical protein